MSFQPTDFSRREFLGASVGATTLALSSSVPAAEPDDVAFFLIGDTHYLADKSQPENLDATSAETNLRLVDVLNRLPGTAIPENAGGGIVATPRGLIHAGDIIDSGDKNGGVYPKMHETEWSGFAADFGLGGKDGRLKMPVYEVYGNHDSPPGDGLVIQQIKERNKSRPGLAGVSKNGVHYSWDWGPVHFLNLGIVVGADEAVARKRRYNPLDSLAFLKSDLKESVGNSGRPVILTHHVDMARYATPPMVDGPATNAEWDPADVRAYYEAIKDYNIIAILFGHTHVREVYQWEGSTKKTKWETSSLDPKASGRSIFNVDNSGHFGGKLQAAFYFHLSGNELVAREFATADRWETVAWTGQVWKKTVNGV